MSRKVGVFETTYLSIGCFVPLVDVKIGTEIIEI